MSILEYNGGAVVAMKGKGCVAIACDTRFGVQAQTIAMDLPKIHKIHNKAFVGFAGLASDNQTLIERLRFRTNLYTLREEREIKPSVLANLVSSMLYERRFGPWFVEPIVCGLEGENGDTPFITAMDLIGADTKASDFVVTGSSASQALFGICESLYKPDLEPEDLFEVISQALLSAVDRDAISGWGAQVVIM